MAKTRSASAKVQDTGVNDKDIKAALREDGFDAYLPVYDLGMESGKENFAVVDEEGEEEEPKKASRGKTGSAKKCSKAKKEDVICPECNLPLEECQC